MILESFEKVELRVLFDLNAHSVQRLDGSVACEEVLRTRSERNDLQILHSIESSGYRNEVLDHVSALFCVSDRILRDVSVYATDLEVVGSIEHTAVSVASAANQVIL